jgi:hypothetical protein
MGALLVVPATTASMLDRDAGILILGWRRMRWARWKQDPSAVQRDVAEAVRYAVTAPCHVAVNEVLIRPTDQI